jgi:type IX secretion system PorP/SprF family membrane protein
MKKWSLIILLFGVLSVARAQQLQVTSFHELQALFYNPSTAGLDQKLTLGVSYRSQWTGTSGAPRTATVFGSVDLPDKKIGVGGYIFSDKTGATSRTGIQLAFAKHIPVSNNAQFSLGIEARAFQFSIDGAKLATELGSDPVLNSSDNKFKFDAGFGISFTNKNFQIGASVSQLIQSKLNFYSGSGSTTEQGKLYRHYYLHGLYKWNIDGATTITPNFLMVYLPNAPTEFQGGIRVEHNEVFWWGLGARIRQGLIASAGVHINKKFKIGYGFEIYRTPYSTYEKGSNAHEILLGYNLSK